MKYFDLPTRRKQLCVLLVAILGYGLLLWTGDFLFPSLDDTTKKRLTQAGVVALYIATLNAGLGFVWASKGRQNEEIARAVKHVSEEKIKLLKYQEKFFDASFQVEIQRAEEALREAERQIQTVCDLPKVYEWCGAASLILVALGTLFCFIGAG